MSTEDITIMMRARGFTPLEKHNENKKHAVFSNLDGKVTRVCCIGKRNMRLQDFNDHPGADVYIASSFTHQAKKSITHSRAEWIPLVNVRCRIMEHPLVLPHESIDGPPEGTRVDELARIMHDDPVVKYLGFSKGQILRIGENKPYFYRVVSSP